MTSVSRVLLLCYSICIVITISMVPILNFVTGFKNLLWISGVANFVATLIIFGFSVFYDNSSIYDPYWSAAPLILVPVYTVLSPLGLNLRNIVINILITFWGWRLIWIAVSRWSDLTHEDFRYKLWRDRLSTTSSTISYWIFSFFSFHLFPTILVFLGIIPTYIALTGDTSAIALVMSNSQFSTGNNTTFGLLDVLATFVTGAAFILETQADRQLRQFQKRVQSNLSNQSSGEKQVIDTGLWSFCRHPNYLGEIMFWWGQVLYALAVVGIIPQMAIACVGAAGISSLIAFGSLPMMEERMQKTRPEQWKQYKSSVPYKLIPLVF